MIDWGVGLMNLYTDVKRIAYVLRAGETAAPAGIQNAFDQALAVREVIRRTIKPGARRPTSWAQRTNPTQRLGISSRAISRSLPLK